MYNIGIVILELTAEYNYIIYKSDPIVDKMSLLCSRINSWKLSYQISFKSVKEKAHIYVWKFLIKVNIPGHFQTISSEIVSLFYLSAVVTSYSYSLTTTETKR